MKVPFLDLSRIDIAIQQRLINKLDQILKAGLFSGGPEVSLLENYIREKLSSNFFISCANGTDALELALRGIEIKPDDEVILPALTWVSTAEAVIMTGAKPIFVDTDENGLISNEWSKAIGKNTKAVIPVHLYGKMAEMTSICSKAKKYGIAVIEDAAQAFGAFQKGKAAGTWGDVGCLSFYPTKNLGALGEAGGCLTQKNKLRERITLLANHGQNRRNSHLLVGRNSRIDTLQAGFLNVLLEEFDLLQIKRKNIARIYLEELMGIGDLILPKGILEADHSAHLFALQFEKRDQLKDHLSTKGIETGVYYPEILPDMPAYYTEGQFDEARRISRQTLSLPLNPWLTENEILEIIKAIQTFF